MHETMIERVIRTAWTELDSQKGWSGSIDFEPVARAILTAMREPTEAMVTANSNTDYPGDERARADWRAMIDAALAQDSP